MVGDNPPRNRMDSIVDSRYTPLIIPQPLSALPADGYLKKFPKFTGEGDITAKEHLATLYSYDNNYFIVIEDVWMRIFVHSLDGEAKKWFRALPPGSIDGIEALDEAFLKNQGDRKDFLYYITEFGSLNKGEGKSISDFSKRFNIMYNKIPMELKPTETSAKITYSSDFDPDFCLLLRERRATSLDHMKYATIEVESNILVVDNIRSKGDRDKIKGRYEGSISSSFVALPQMEEVTKLLKSLSASMEIFKLEEKKSYRNPQIDDNRGSFKRAINAPQKIQRD
jgi:hypothetical protein